MDGPGTIAYTQKVIKKKIQKAEHSINEPMKLSAIQNKSVY